MGETSHSERFDVVWQYEVSPLESGAGPCGQQQSERAAGARPDLHTGERSCRPDHVDQIPTYGLAQLDALHRLAQGQDRAGVRDLSKVELFLPAFGATPDHVPFRVAVGVADRDTE